MTDEVRGTGTPLAKGTTPCEGEEGLRGRTDDSGDEGDRPYIAYDINGDQGDDPSEDAEQRRKRLGEKIARYARWECLRARAWEDEVRGYMAVHADQRQMKLQELARTHQDGLKTREELDAMWNDAETAMETNRGVQDDDVRVTLVVDAHADLRVGAALDRFGRRLGARSGATTTAAMPC